MKCEEFKQLNSRYTNFPIADDFEGSNEHEDWQEHSVSCKDCIEWNYVQIVEDRGFLVKDFPCSHMAYHVTFKCDEHDDPWQCPDYIIVYTPKFNEYGIPVRDGGASNIVISHCPWCGIKLPESLNDRWFDELEKFGYDDPWEQDIPENFKSDKWWRDMGL